MSESASSPLTPTAGDMAVVLFTAAVVIAAVSVINEDWGLVGWFGGVFAAAMVTGWYAVVHRPRGGADE